MVSCNGKIDKTTSTNLFDDVLKQYSVLMTRKNHPRRVSKTNNNNDMMSYTAVLTKDSTSYDLNKRLPPKSTLKRNFTVSHDINVTNDFSNINNKHLKNTKRANTRSNGPIRRLADYIHYYKRYKPRHSTRQK